MNVLGLRCSNRDYTFVVIDGTRESPNVIETETISYPRSYSKPLALKWFLQEIENLIGKHNVLKIVIKASESRRCSKAYEERVEHEAIAILAAANCGLKAVFKKVKSTIAKDMGLKGRAHYLSKIDTTVIHNFDSYNEKTREAVLAAWSEIR